MSDWRQEFERRALAAASAPEGSTFDGIEGGAESWAYSEYTQGTDTYLEVTWTTPDGKYGSRRFETMGELIDIMNEVE